MIGLTLVSRQALGEYETLPRADGHFRNPAPLDVTHFVFWSRVPIIHPDIVPSKIWDRIEQDGLWGFSGSDHIAVPKTLDEKDDEDTARMVEQAHHECAEFVNKHWPTDEWETAWFINPPVRCRDPVCRGYA